MAEWYGVFHMTRHLILITSLIFHHPLPQINRCVGGFENVFPEFMHSAASVQLWVSKQGFGIVKSSSKGDSSDEDDDGDRSSRNRVKFRG